MIIGIGTDIISVTRIGQMCDRLGNRFTDRVFTRAEQDTVGCGPGAYERLAARFAAKEAVMKALGTGWARGVNFRDIEVVTEPSGRPAIALHGEAKARAERKGTARVHLSLSHEREHAIAFVILEGVTPEAARVDAVQPFGATSPLTAPAPPTTYTPESLPRPLQYEARRNGAPQTPEAGLKPADGEPGGSAPE